MENFLLFFFSSDLNCMKNEILHSIYGLRHSRDMHTGTFIHYYMLTGMGQSLIRQV
jgi:hypothetical protein